VIYRSIPDLDPPADADVDAPDLARADAAIDLCERYQVMLARIAEIGMEMIEAGARQAKADGGAGDPDAFCKVSQAVRRTVALHVKLARDARTDRNTVQAERARRRADGARARKTAKDEAILFGLHDAYFGSGSEPEFDPGGYLFDRMMDVDVERLDDSDEFAGYLDRPVGETLAKLCAIVGLDPGACVLDDGVWRVWEAPAPIPPSARGEGGSERSDETGGERRRDHDPTVICGSSISGADPPACSRFTDSLSP